MTWQGAFRVFIRVIFIFAYIAFLAASIRHVATFFHNFESDPTDWVNPYTLAVSIDLTALVLTVGVMFFRGNMPWYAQALTWLFIVALTAFSWFVNWEYAMTYQGNDLRVNDTLRMLNPILASSFAFLNLAYSVVAEFFSSKNETAAELAAKVDELEQIEEQQRRLASYKQRTKKPGVIERVKNTALEAKAAVDEVMKRDEDPSEVGTTLAPIEHKTVPTSVPETDPNLHNVVPQVSANIGVPSAQSLPEDEENFEESLVEDDPKVSPNFGQSSEPTTDKLLPKDTQKVEQTFAKPGEKVTQKLYSDALETFEQTSAKDPFANRNAITIDEAAEYLEVSPKTIQNAITSGKLKLYGTTKDKVLVSTVKTYTSSKRSKAKVSQK